MNRRLFALAGITAAIMVGTAGTASAEPISTGHVDVVDVDYASGALTVQLLDQTGAERDPATVDLVVLPGARTTVPNNAAYAFLGAPGDPVWILPQTQNTTLLWPGWNATDVPSGAFQSNTLQMSLISVTGGELAIYTTSLGNPTVLFDNGNGLPDTRPLATGAHTLQCLIDSLGGPCAAGPVDPDKLGADVLARLHGSLPGANDRLGTAITDVDVQSIGVPSDVKQAFDAIAKAHDEVKIMKTSADADVARRKVEVKNEAASVKADAEAYRHQAVADANAAVARFERILPQYRAAPQVTRHRLWLDTMQAVLTRNRVVVNTGTGDVIVQFPAQHPEVNGAPASAASGASPPPVAPAPPASAVAPVTSGPGVQAVD